MSAPDTNIERQTRRHKGPLIGILVAVCIATAGFLGLLFFKADDVPSPAPEATVAPADASPGAASQPPAGN